MQNAYFLKSMSDDRKSVPPDPLTGSAVAVAPK